MHCICYFLLTYYFHSVTSSVRSSSSADVNKFCFYANKFNFIMMVAVWFTICVWKKKEKKVWNFFWNKPVHSSLEPVVASVKLFKQYINICCFAAYLYLCWCSWKGCHSFGPHGIWHFPKLVSDMFHNHSVISSLPFLSVDCTWTNEISDLLKCKLVSGHNRK